VLLIRVLRVTDVLLIVKECLVVYVIHPTVNVVRKDLCDLHICKASLFFPVICIYICMYFYNFVLSPAYTGDVCIPNPCLNGGTCQTQGLLGFTCQCRSGFQGLTCQICKYFIKKINKIL